MAQAPIALNYDSPTQRWDRFVHVVPLAFVTYSLAFLDRVNYGYAEAAGLSASLKISENIAALLPALFFIGYFLFQVPAANWASKRNVKWLVFWALIAWGLLSGLTGVLKSVSLLIAVRLLLGAVEGVVLPAMLIFLTRWFTKPERSRANALLILANPVMMIAASLISGFLISYFNRHPVPHFLGWQMMFVLEGLPSIIWAVLWVILAQERPVDARWLDPGAAAKVQGLLDEEQRSMQHIRDYWAAFADQRVILLSLMYMSFSAAGYGLMFWLPKIIKQATSDGIAATGVLSAVPYAIGMIAMIAVSYASDRTLKRKRFVVGSMFAGAIGYAIAYFAGAHDFWLMFTGLIVVGCCIYTPCGPLWAWMGDMLPRNVVGESMALVNSAGALGGFIGTYLFGLIISKLGNGPGFAFLACLFTLAGILGLLAQSNQRRPVGFEPIVGDMKPEPEQAAAH